MRLLTKLTLILAETDRCHLTDVFLLLFARSAHQADFFIFSVVTGRVNKRRRATLTTLGHGTDMILFVTTFVKCVCECGWVCVFLSMCVSMCYKL